MLISPRRRNPRESLTVARPSAARGGALRVGGGVLPGRIGAMLGHRTFCAYAESLSALPVGGVAASASSLRLRGSLSEGRNTRRAGPPPRHPQAARARTPRNSDGTPSRRSMPGTSVAHAPSHRGCTLRTLYRPHGGSGRGATPQRGGALEAQCEVARATAARGHIVFTKAPGAGRHGTCASSPRHPLAFTCSARNLSAQLSAILTLP